MVQDIIIRQAVPEDAEGVCRVVREAFIANVAPENSREGAEFFLRVQSAAYFGGKIPEFISAYVAEKSGEIIGVIAIGRKLSTFFILPEHQRSGLGKRLLSIAVADWAAKTSEAVLLVNSSPNALEACKKMGFVPAGKEDLANNVRFFPMQADVKSLIR